MSLQHIDFLAFKTASSYSPFISLLLLLDLYTVVFDGCTNLYSH